MFFFLLLLFPIWKNSWVTMKIIRDYVKVLFVWARVSYSSDCLWIPKVASLQLPILLPSSLKFWLLLFMWCLAWTQDSMHAVQALSSELHYQHYIDFRCGTTCKFLFFLDLCMYEHTCVGYLCVYLNVYMKPEVDIRNLPQELEDLSTLFIEAESLLNPYLTNTTKLWNLLWYALSLTSKALGLDAVVAPPGIHWVLGFQTRAFTLAQQGF